MGSEDSDIHCLKLREVAAEARQHMAVRIVTFTV